MRHLRFAITMLLAVALAALTAGCVSNETPSARNAPATVPTTTAEPPPPKSSLSPPPPEQTKPTPPGLVPNLQPGAAVLVGVTLITEKQVERRVEQLTARMRSANTKPPAADALRRRIATELVRRTVLEQEAARLGIRSNGSAGIAEFKRNLPGKAFTLHLQQIGMTEKDLARELAFQEITRKISEALVLDTTVSAAELAGARARVPDGIKLTDADLRDQILSHRRAQALNEKTLALLHATPVRYAPRYQPLP